MKEDDEESVPDDESNYILTFESFNVSFKEEENTSIHNRINSFASESGCSKSCTEYRKIRLNGPQTSACEPQALRESSYCQKEPETKQRPTEVPLFDRLKIKMKETSRKLQVLFLRFSSPSSKYFCTSWRLSIDNFQQSALPFLKKTTRRAMTKVRSLYNGLRPKRILGFKCDLKKCDNTVMDCSVGTCRKKGMFFDEFSHPCSSKTINSSVSDVSTGSSTSEDRF